MSDKIMDFEKAIFSCGVKIENKILASAYYSNSLVEIDCETGKCTFVSSFGGTSGEVNALHGNAVRYNNKAFFIPTNSQYLSIVDIESYESKIFNLGDGEKGYACVQKDKFLYLVSYHRDNLILVFDMECEEIVKTIVVDETTCQGVNGIANDKLVVRATIIDDKLYFCWTNTSDICCVDLKTESISLLNAPSSELFGCFGSGDILYILNSNKPVVHAFDTQKHVWTTIMCIPDEKIYGNFKFGNHIVMRNQILLLPKNDDRIFMIKEDKLVVFAELNKDRRILKDERRFLSPIVDLDESWLLPFGYDLLYSISEEYIVGIDVRKIEYPLSKRGEMLDAYIGKSIMKESEEISLEQFIEHMNSK